MPTLYKSILIIQPTQGQIVFMRRFTRDPPILAAWDQITQSFGPVPSISITVTGSTAAGIYTANYDKNLVGTNKPGWSSGTVAPAAFIASFNPPLWQIGVLTEPGAGWTTADFAYDGSATTAVAFVTFGAPASAAPTSIAVPATMANVLTIPAAFVSAWRPQ